MIWFKLTFLTVLALAVCEVTFDLYSDTPDDSLAAQYGKLSNDSLLWGPYRTALYFGLRPRIPRSLLLGLMWFNIDLYTGIGTIRHFYEQGDNMKQANWVRYDPRFGGRQIIKDIDSHIDITIDFVKSNDGQSWGVKVRAKPHKGYENVKTSFVWYSGLEGERKNVWLENLTEEPSASYFSLDNVKDLTGYSDHVKFSGISQDLGFFELEINDGPKLNKHPKKRLVDPGLDPQKTHHISLRVPDDNVWMAKDIFMTLLQELIEKLVESHGTLEGIPPEQAFIIRDLQNFAGNVHFVQKVYEGACEFDLVFNNAITPDHDKITFENINSKIKSTLAKFDEKFASFSPQAPFNDKKYEKFSKEIVSGLLGGLSYFYGDHLVDRETVFDEDSFESYELHGTPEGPHELFTLVPSRPFFPRGFYWDEGFHLLPLLNYDSDLVWEILKSWFNLIDEDGWIAREQILGPELRSRVPEAFQVQSPEVVNPPTLMLVFSYLLESHKNSGFGGIDEPIVVGDTITKDNLGSIVMNNPGLLMNYTAQIYPKLKQHYQKFRKTQQGYVEEFDRGTNTEAYRWRGRTLTHCLASGLDDYPRALPADIAELNVDLLSWMGVMTRSIKLIAELLNYEKDIELYAEIEKNVVENLENLHWSQEDKSYCDVSVNEDDENIFVCHKGYISLFPFLTKLMPAESTEKLESLVDMIADPEQLWTGFGIRSLSKQDEFYGKDENYWRSPIWVHMNYLILDSLQHYKQVSKVSPELSKKISDTYRKLRLNVVENVYKQWKNTGFVWENYDDETGVNKGAKNFLGWTSTVAVIMSMPERI